MEDIKSKVIKIISEQLGKDESEIQMNSHFIEDLDADSLDTVELIMQFEEEFEMDNSLDAGPVIYATHPDMNDIDGDNLNDTLIVQKQSYNATVWTGLLSLPVNYVGKAIKLNISNAKENPT